MSVMFRLLVSVYAVFAIVLFAILIFSASPARASETFVVNDTGDAPDADASDGNCLTKENVCTLRAAIEQANTADGMDTIEFEIAGNGPHTISPGTSLPTISEAVTIDGYTQTAATAATAEDAATLKIELDGSAGNIAGGITIGPDGGGSTVRGLAVGGFSEESSGYGIHLLSDGNTIEGNHIGTNVAGGERAYNSSTGVLIENASDNVIGGTDAADRNVISGNGAHGVWILGTFNEPESATDNVILGNYIGTDATGTKRLANGDSGEGFGGFGSGVQVTQASGNTIGGKDDGARNIVSGNGQYGIHVTSRSSNNEVLGNYIGTDVTGTDSITNEQDGVRISNNSTNNSIGEPGAGNVISGNNSTTSVAGPSNSGVVIGFGSGSAGTSGNEIQGNFIGTDKTGTLPLGNSERNDERGDFFTGNGNYGVRVVNAPGNLIGGEAEGEGNVISGNKGSTFQNGVVGTGVSIVGPGATDNEIEGNRIGTDVSGKKRLSNIEGIEILDAPDNVIGGVSEGSRNIISGNIFSGIAVDGEFAGDNEIKGNFIGTDVSGTEAIANVTGLGGIPAAVSVLAPRTVIGGTEEGAGNVISGNGRVTADGQLSGFGISVGGRGIADPELYAGTVIQGNFIGTDATGTKDLGNLDCAVIISDVPDNLVGGAEEGAGNVISGNGKAGIQIDSPGASGNKVLGNFIGTDVSGDVAIGNDGTGVLVTGAPENIIGEPGAGNVVSGGILDEGNGIRIQNEAATGNSVQANFVGTDASGTKDLGNSRSGISVISASENVIGGAAEGEGNVVSGNGEDGILISNPDSTDNIVHGNFAGTDAAGGSPLPNGNAGVSVLGAVGNTIGGAGEGAGNVLSGNTEDGVYIAGEAATDNEILGNHIGADESGASDLGNGRDGVRVTEGAGGNTFGGPDANSENSIAFNGARGILLRETAGNGNTILRNSIFENDDLGIDLGEDGVTANDAKDRDSGPNSLQNFPAIGEVSNANGKTNISGSLNSTPGEKFVLRFFASPDSDPSGYGEGKTFVGQRTVTTNASGKASFDFALPETVAAGGYVAATATSATGDTSEFSKAVEAVKGEAGNEPKPNNPNRCTIRGTNGDDVLRGSPKRDVICGLGGDDVIRGMGGNDIIRGGSGDDLLFGGSGNDTLIGGKGEDVLRGEGGNDTLNVRDGVRGNDVGNGGAGRDRCAADKNDVKRSCP